MVYKNIILEKKDGIARLTINRPPVNVVNYEAISEINDALEELKKDDASKVLLFRGAGNKAFCAGVEVKDHIGDAMPLMMREFGRIFILLKNLGKPSIAVVNGPDVKAENTVEKPNEVGTKESSLKVTGTSFTYTFEPHSITALVCAVN